MRLAGFSAMGDFWRVIREFNPEGIEREATAPLEIWVAGEPGSGRRTLVQSLMGDRDGAGPVGPFRVLDFDYQRPLPEDGKPDLVILVVRLDRDLADLGRRAAPLLVRGHYPLLLVFTRADAVETTRELRNAAYRAFSFVSYLKTVFLDARDAGQVRALVAPLMVESLPSLRTALARLVPGVRPLVSEQIISETCRVNAQFALAANLPANLPILGGVAGTVAEIFVLTKNQVMMVFRLAAIYGRDIALTARVAAEIAPVIGGAFLWRTVARTVVGILPSLLAIGPKTAIAYVGTYVVGHAAMYYYDEGRRPSPQLMKKFSTDGSNIFHRRAMDETGA